MSGPGMMRIKAAASALVAATLALAGLVSPAQAQSSPSAYTSATRYDAMNRVVGTIAPDPDAAGPLKYAATRTTYDDIGRVTKVETGELVSWQSEAVAPASWPMAPANPTGFTVLSTAETTYDALDRKLTDLVKGSDGITVSLTQYSYDIVGRLQCSAARMNPAVYGSLPASACTLGTEGGNGPDRVTKNIYDAAGQLLQLRKAVGTSIEIADATMSYTNNGQLQFVIDANGNKAEKRYDGYDRQVKWVFPSTTRPGAFNASTLATAVSSAGALNEGDYELYGYDTNGNRTSLRKRDGSTLTYQYDALNRMAVKIVPERTGLAVTHTRDVFYSYDLRGLQTGAKFDSASGEGVTSAWDGFGRMSTSRSNQEGLDKTLTYTYDKNGNRTQITHPDAQFFQLDYDGLNRPVAIRENTVVMGSVSYNQRGLPSQRSWTNGAASANAASWAYDPVGRLNNLAIDINNTGSDVTWSYSRNPASQILSETQSNDNYSWGGHVNLDRAYTTNGLNQYSAAGGASFCYDANGNLTADGGSVYLYDVENRLVEKRVQTNTTCTALSYGGTLQASLRYDPLGRLFVTDGPSGLTRYLYDGDARVAEFNAAHTLLRRYVHGADSGADDPLIWYEGSLVDASARRYLHSDPRGSVVSVTNYLGNALATNTYDEYGIPSSANIGAFQYTGQVWLTDVGMYYYKARIYSPTLGRFLQTDPIGYDDQYNLYAYVGNDPVNKVDPDGKEGCTLQGCPRDVLVVTGRHPADDVDRPMNWFEKTLWGAAGTAATLVAAPEALAARVLVGAVRMTRAAQVAAPVARAVARERFAIAKAGLGTLEKGGGKAIAGTGTKTELRQAERLAGQYGGKAGDYAKVTTGATKTGDGASVQVHAYRNIETGKIYEPKLKIQ